MDMFWGRPIDDWCDIYALLKFRGNELKSFRDLLEWREPSSPQGCVNLAFDLAEARAAKYEYPVFKWVENILVNDRRNPEEKPPSPGMGGNVTKEKLWNNF